jgi:tubulin--tyrosine ligase
MLSSIVYYPSSYTSTLIRQTLNSRGIETVDFKLDKQTTNDQENEDSDPPTLIPSVSWSSLLIQWMDFDYLHWPTILSCTSISSSYLTRKGLIRKAQFAYFLRKFASKRPDSILNHSVPESYNFVVEDPEYFDEALCEAPELKLLGWKNPEEHENDYQTEESEALKPILESDYPPWILKASMINGGAGIYLLRSLDDVSDAIQQNSDIQEWIYQRYIQNPLLINKRKFHLRVYVICTGNLTVHFSTDCLALFAAESYQPTAGHITNSCVNSGNEQWDPQQHIRLAEELFSPSVYNNLLIQITSILHDTFQALHGEPTCFMPFANCFELLGFDFLCDSDYKVWLLEGNASPDFSQTGEKLKVIVERLIENTAKLVVDPILNQPKSKLEDLNLATFSLNVSDWENLSDVRDFSCPYSPSSHLVKCYQRIVSDSLRQRMKVF